MYSLDAIQAADTLETRRQAEEQKREFPRPMAHAYTPGLRVTERATLHRKRILPIRGKVLVEKGQRVRATDTVASADLPGRVHTVNVANMLSSEPDEIQDYMLKKEGAWVAKGETIAESRPLIRWFRTQVPSPAQGTIDTISRVTGQVLVREPATPLELKAYIDGTVTEIFPSEGCSVSTVATFVQGIFGVGRETHGALSVAVKGPDAVLSASDIRPEHRGHVLVGGAFAGSDTWDRAREVGVRALIVGGIDDQDLRKLLGYDLGVAITGTEDVGFTLVVTEGFGKITMARRTFDLLACSVGKQASVSGATQIRAGVIRPEVIIPLEPSAGAALDAPTRERAGLGPGDPVRIIREPHFGRIGKVKSLPPEPILISTESKVRILEVVFPEGTTAVVPRTNVEIIEE